MADDTTEEPVKQGRMKAEKERISGLKMMVVFVGCGVLVTLGWGGVTSAPVSMSEACWGGGAV